MSDREHLKIYFVLGEESGDILGAELLDAFEKKSVEITAQGLAGKRLQARGVESLFDISDISVMGVSGVVARLPLLLKRISQTVNDIIDKKPDVLLLIDSPDFSYRVAKKVRRACPEIKIIKFVAPSVWAWRAGRAKKISAYIDHILAILPFEPDLIRELGGPETTFVGHPIGSTIPNISTKKRKSVSDPVKLIVLPGSRKNEIKLLMPIIKATLERLIALSDKKFEIVLPAVERVESDIRSAIVEWNVKPQIVVGDEAKKKAFTEAELALCASGTAVLELAVYKVPLVSIYKLDWMMMAVRRIITAWTAALPNLIAGYPFIPERINEYANPEYIARLLNRLAEAGPEREAQLEGFETVIKHLKQEVPSQDLAVEKILEVVQR